MVFASHCKAAVTSASKATCCLQGFCCKASRRTGRQCCSHAVLALCLQHELQLLLSAIRQRGGRSKGESDHDFLSGCVRSSNQISLADMMHVGVTLPTLGSHGHLFPAGYPFECVGPIWGTACFAQASQTTAKTCTPEVTKGGCACMRDVARIAKHDTLVVTREGVQWHITSTLFALALKRGCLERSQWHELQFGCYALLRHWCHPCTNVFTWAQSRNRIQHLLYNAAVPLTVSCDGRQVGKQHAPCSAHSPEAGPPATCKPLGLGCFLFASAVAPALATFARHDWRNA